MLYRYGKYKGQHVADDDLNHILLLNGFIGVGVATLITLIFASTVFFAAPFWLGVIIHSLFMGAATYLGGMLFGVINNLLAAQLNLPYLLLGNKEQQISLLTTNDKIAQGVARGVADSLGLVLMATAVVVSAATITALFVPLATFIFPAILTSLPLLAIGAGIYARSKINEHYNQAHLKIGENQYQIDGLNIVSPTRYEQATWLANQDRHSFIVFSAPALGAVGLLALLGISIASVFFPPLLATSLLLTVILPATFAGASALTLGGLGLYMHIKRDQQVDNRERLDFESDHVNYNLYLAEDMTYVNTVLLNSGMTQTASATAQGAFATQHHASPLTARVEVTNKDHITSSEITLNK